MVGELNPLAPAHMPPFITAPGETDTLMVFVALSLIATILFVGTLFFKLHSMPERMAHRANKVQFEIVAVLGLLSLLTHNHAFWVAGLLLALVQIPDITSPLGAMARSLERLAGGPEPRSGPEPEPVSDADAGTDPPPAPPVREVPSSDGRT
jgi:hypothetical protein